MKKTIIHLFDNNLKSLQKHQDDDQKNIHSVQDHNLPNLVLAFKKKIN